MSVRGRTQSLLAWRNMKEHVSFLHLTMTFLRIRKKSKREEQRDGESDRQKVRVTKTLSLPARDIQHDQGQSRKFKKQKYHSQKIRSTNINKDMVDSSLERKQYKQFSKRRFSLKNASEKRKLNESCPDLNKTIDDLEAPETESSISSPVCDKVDSVDPNTLHMFRDLSLCEVESLK